MELRPILCIVGAILINLTLGTFYSIGNVLPYMASYMRNNGNPNVTTEHGTWITAAFLLGQGLFIIVGSYIEKKTDSRKACILGCTLHCASTFLTSWALNVNFTAVVIIYGLGSGLGCGSSYMASIIAVQKWFPNRKGFFTGIIVAGFGLGGLLFTSFQTMYMNPENIAQNSDGYFVESVYSRTPGLFLYMGLIFTIMQVTGCALSFPPPSSTPLLGQVHSNSNQTTSGASPTIVNEDTLPNLESIFATFKHKIFYVICLLMMLVAPGVIFINSLGKRFGQTYISDDRYLATVVAVSAVANASGRLTWGFLIDRFPFSICYTAKVLLFAFLITLFPYSFVLSSRILYMIWMLGLFFGFSGTFVLFPIFIERAFGVKYHGMIYGMAYILFAGSTILTALLIQVTIAPSLAKSKDGEDGLVARATSCTIIALLYIISLLLYWSLLPVRRLENAMKRRNESNSTARTSLAQRQDLYPINGGSLAEKTAAANATRNDQNGVDRITSLGSIVRFQEAPTDNDNKIKLLVR